MIFGDPSFDDLVAQLRRDHDVPERAYHVFAHVEDCLAKLDLVHGISPDERRILTYAFLWHDSIYDATRTDNEEESAKRARRDLNSIKADPAEIEEAARLILLTKGHRVEDGDKLGAIMVSIDLSILGSDPGTYKAYAKAIRHEYRHVPEGEYRVGRCNVLRHFLAADLIYPLATFRILYEDQARTNLQVEIKDCRTKFDVTSIRKI